MSVLLKKTGLDGFNVMTSTIPDGRSWCKLPCILMLAI